MKETITVTIEGKRVHVEIDPVELFFDMVARLPKDHDTSDLEDWIDTLKNELYTRNM